MIQTRRASLIEETVKRAVVLFVISPLVAMWWLPANGRAVMGYADALWLSLPFVLCALVSGYVIRRLFACRT